VYCTELAVVDKIIWWNKANEEEEKPKSGGTQASQKTSLYATHADNSYTSIIYEHEYSTVTAAASL
jgi:hypothetical protein